MKYFSLNTTNFNKDAIVFYENTSTSPSDNEIEQVLNSKHLFKSLSLFLSLRSGIKIPPTIVLLENRLREVECFGGNFDWPLMIRMDFARLPQKKTLGGIPIRSLLIAKYINKFLFGYGCNPIYHPHFDRFKDLYSCGILISANSPEIQIEVVGKGFDASDLRLGKATPHESIKVDLINKSIIRSSGIQRNNYIRQRKERIGRIMQFNLYINFANNYGKLLPNLDQFDSFQDEISATIARRIPRNYSPIPEADIRNLCKVAETIQIEVIPRLPKSDKYVASFSKLPEQNWMLWDIYGSWYSR